MASGWTFISLLLSPCWDRNWTGRATGGAINGRPINQRHLTDRHVEEGSVGPLGIMEGGTRESVGDSIGMKLSLFPLPPLCGRPINCFLSGMWITLHALDPLVGRERQGEGLLNNLMNFVLSGLNSIPS